MAIATLPQAEVRSVPYRMSIEMAGMFMALLGAWGAIVPFVGPLFGYNIDGSSAWTWNLTHTMLFLVPGAVAFLAGMIVMIEGAAGTTHRSASLLLGGMLAVLAGAWFVVGPLAWPVIQGVHVFSSGSSFRVMTYWVGSALGPGGLIVALGAFVLGRPHPNRLSPSQVQQQVVVHGDASSV